MNIVEKESLANHTTFKVGGPGRYFCVVKNIEDLKSALDFAMQKNLEYFVLAGGSNLIVSDDGYNGLVIKTELDNLEVNDSKIRVGSGFVLDILVDIANEKGLKGLQWAGGLPGTIGGAIRGNAGAFGGEIKDVVINVKSQNSPSKTDPTGSENLKNIEIINRDNKQCEFGYRTSVFKHNKEIILEVELQMQKGDSQELQKIANEHRQYRQDKHPLEYGCAGSIFKNIPPNTCTYEVQERFKDFIKSDPFPVIPTAAIIADAGLKGYQIGEAQVSEKHPNYIINLGHATASDIIKLIEYEIKVVKEKYSINLEVEPQLVGFDKKYKWESR